MTASIPQNDDPSIWKALADPHRRALLDLLRQEPRTTGELAACFRVSRFAVMKHLDLLVQAGLVTVEKRGRQRWNHLNPVPLQQVVRRWLRPFAQLPAEALLRLREAAEQPLTPGETEMAPTAALSLCAYEVRLEIKIRAPRRRVWEALTSEIVRWWPKTFYAGPKARNFLLEAHVGGRLYEDWGSGAGGLWGTIVVCQPEEKLHWVYDHFPDFCGGGTGRAFVAVTLQADGKQTIVTFEDRGHGNLGPGLRDSLQSGWEELIGGHLRAYVEDGTQPERPETLEP